MKGKHPKQTIVMVTLVINENSTAKRVLAFILISLINDNYDETWKNICLNLQNAMCT
jgi:hypothetical protein